MKRALTLFFCCLFLPLIATPTLHDSEGNLLPSARQFIELFDKSDLEIQQGKERWELQKICHDQLEEALPLLKQIGCIDSIHAEKNNYDYALVLGSLGEHMQLRLDFLYEQWSRGIRFDQVVLLTGKRDLDPKREFYPTELKTEKDLFIHLFEKHPLSSEAQVIVIDSDKIAQDDGSFRRPDTAQTVRDWISTGPQPGKVLAVSTQPFVGYQNAVLCNLLGNRFDIETIGPETKIYPMALYLDNFAKWMLYERQ